MKFLEFFYLSEGYERFAQKLMVVSPWKGAVAAIDDSVGDLAFDSESYSRIVSAAETAVVSPLRGLTGKIMPRIARAVEKLAADPEVIGHEVTLGASGHRRASLLAKSLIYLPDGGR